MSAHARAPLVPGIRALRILWRMLAPLAVCAVLLACTWILGADDSLKQQALVLAAVILGFTLLVAVIHELLSPNRPRLRVIPMANHRAERLRVIARGLLFILLGTELAIYLVRANGWSESVASLLALLRTVGLILFAWAAISRSGLLDKLTPESGETYRGLFMRVLLRVVFPLAVLTLLFYVICSALGYVSLAGWAVRNAAWSAGVVLVGVLLLRYLRRRLRGAVNFMRDERTAGEEDVAPAYIGLERVLGGAAKLVIVGGAVLLVLSIWGIHLDDAGGILAQPVMAGGEHTWGMFFFGLLKVAVVVIAGAFVKNVLIFFVFPKADVELGARYAILTVLRYTVVVFGVLFAFASVGVGTSTLAVFAGGATVGLAFGMKDIFSNFFSGMIMLLERPVRVGDSVAVAGVEGKIEAIRLRGTTIRTFDGTTVIIPNTQMIGERLTSLSYGLHTARMQVDVGVSYDADPHEVERVLLDVARADERVLDDPAPFVRFNTFGASSLDFLLRCYTHEVGDRHSITSQLKVAVLQALKKNGIEIPFPQQDVHFRTGVQVEGTPSPERDPPSV